MQPPPWRGLHGLGCGLALGTTLLSGAVSLTVEIAGGEQPLAVQYKLAGHVI